MVAREAPHLLILDEPTNHLDIDSRRALLDALNDYEGAVLLITHDRSLMELVADQFWLTAGGTIRPFDGDLEDYAKVVLEQARTAARGPRPVDPLAPAAPVVSLSTLRHRLQAAEQALAAAARAAEALDQALADPGLFQREPVRAADLGRQRVKAKDAVDRAEAAWIEAAEAYERGQATASRT